MGIHLAAPLFAGSTTNMLSECDGAASRMAAPVSLAARIESELLPRLDVNTSTAVAHVVFDISNLEDGILQKLPAFALKARQLQHCADKLLCMALEGLGSAGKTLELFLASFCSNFRCSIAYVKM